MSDRMISFSSIYGFGSREPMIHLEWGSQKGSITVSEARAHALAVLETAEAAVADAFVFEFFKEKLAGKPEDPTGDKAGAIMMQEYRDWRQQRGYGGGIDPVDHRPLAQGPTPGAGPNRAQRRRKK